MDELIYNFPYNNFVLFYQAVSVSSLALCRDKIGLGHLIGKLLCYLPVANEISCLSVG